MNDRFLIGLIDVDCMKYDRLSCRYIININQQRWILKGFILYIHMISYAGRESSS